MYWPVIGAGRCIPLSGSALKAWASLGQRWRFAALQGQAVGKVRNLSESFHGMLFCGGVLRSLRGTHLSLQGSWCQAGTSAPHGVPVPYPLGLGMWVARPTTLSEGWKSLEDLVGPGADDRDAATAPMPADHRPVLTDPVSGLEGRWEGTQHPAPHIEAQVGSPLLKATQRCSLLGSSIPEKVLVMG